jgi:hypothetical protein
MPVTLRLVLLDIFVGNIHGIVALQILMMYIHGIVFHKEHAMYNHIHKNVCAICS